MTEASSEVRLQKIIANHTEHSRRDAERLIEEGSVTVNGKTAKLGDKAILSDHIKVSGRLLKIKSHSVTRVVALYKPKGVLPNKVKDDKTVIKRRKNIFHLLPKKHQDLLPVGRLDTDAEGIMLLTNDGLLSQRLCVGKYEIQKSYDIKIDGELIARKLKHLNSSVKIEGRKLRETEVTITEKTKSKTWLKVITTETRNRVMRKMFESVGHPVDKIKRTKFAFIGSKGVKIGAHRELSPHEIVALEELVGLSK